jgi:threonine dehydrogenase-like Zn-dependent dehydrogenase
MKAVAVFPKTREVRVLTDAPEPKLRSTTQVRVRTLEVGVCGTDKEIADFRYGTPPEGDDLREDS